MLSHAADKVAALGALLDGAGTGPAFRLAEAIASAVAAETDTGIARSLRGRLESCTTSVAWAVRARLAMQAGDRPLALSAVRAALNSAPAPDAELLLVEARLLAAADNMAEAAASAREALCQFPAHDLYLRHSGLVDRIMASGSWTPRRRLRLAIVGGGTTRLLAEAIRMNGFRDGMEIEFYEGPFGSWRQETGNPRSGLYTFEPDVVVIVLNHRDLDLPPDGARAQAERMVDEVVALWRMLRERSTAHVVHLAFDMPPEGSWGGLEDARPDGRRQAIRLANNLLQENRIPGVSIIDPARLSGQIREVWNAQAWYQAKHYPAPHAVPAFSELIVAACRSITGMTSKVLVVDLDNTIWGGVVGEVGVGGLVLGAPSADGESFVDLQRHLKELTQRGILLAVCSKNESADALRPFAEHDAMVLKRDDLAAFVANWNDKAANIQAIAGDLDLGIDSMVFLDDNPLERSWVRTRLPQVKVVENDGTPAGMLSALRRGRYFEAVDLTEEDFQRGRSYKARAAIRAVSDTSRTAEDFLAGLGMVCRHGPVGDATVKRVAQLVNRTNQFNLTCRRYSETQVAAMAVDPGWWCRWFRLQDRYGDHGLVGAVFMRKATETWTIDIFLMSCRVLGRDMERFMARCALTAARDAGASRVYGEYLPDARNGLVSDLLPRLGFKPAEGSRLCFDVAADTLPEAGFIRDADVSVRDRVLELPVSS